MYAVFLPGSRVTESGLGDWMRPHDGPGLRIEHEDDAIEHGRRVDQASIGRRSRIEEWPTLSPLKRFATASV